MQAEEISGFLEVRGCRLCCVGGAVLDGCCLCCVGAAVLAAYRLCRVGGAVIVGRGFFCVGRAAQRFFAGAGSVFGVVDCVVVLGRGDVSVFR